MTASRGASVGLYLIVACAAPSKAAPTAQDGLRRTERTPVWPTPALSTEASTGLTVLRPPPARQLARRAVQAFFEAVRHESVSELSAWLSEDATISSGPGTTPESIAKVWSARFKQLDYGFNGAKEPYRLDDVGLFTADELLGLPERRFELAPDADELLAVVTTRDRRRAAGPRHFGKRLEFVLGPTAEGYRIRRMYEDFRLP